ncbi:DNA translocase FtsK 4TM domain-containing protein [Psychrobacter vallis]|uniref:DNA translocase FtsK 4TM domain-containing protein n=1 Tax=Psychrobacter vallis TaxID=248451 RepID=UPI001919099B|nr:DNA translocase FtsK 4TM domain-containing protein [Psychrobacter vallis]
MISAPLIEYLKKGIFTLLGLILAVYLFVILMTYTGNDPSWSHISSDMTTINNVGGETGAWLSDLLYSFFGFGAWWLLAFVVYESILIWWDNKPTFWLMRLVAYVFLLLSASALFAQILALVQQITNPASTELEGLAGGIIGLELQARLAQLLSQWGSVVFLTVFVVITATFAFNIHWLAIYQKITALSWLGSGIKNTDMSPDNGSTTQENAITKQNDKNTAKTTTESAASEYEQLPLELQSADHANHSQAADNNGRFGNVLSEFLVNSGLADSVKASMAATQAAMSSSDKSEDLNTSATANGAITNGAITKGSMANGNMDNMVSQTNTSVTANPTMLPARKVEPSFAWNDANTVDDLLASEQTAYSANGISHANAASIANNDASTNFISTESLSTESISTESISTESLDEPSSITTSADEQLVAQSTGRLKTKIVEQPIKEWEDNETVNRVVTESTSFESKNITVGVDTLADAWLTEHADVLKPADVDTDKVAQTDNIAEWPATETVAEPELEVVSDFSNEPSHHAESPTVFKTPAVLASTAVASPASEAVVSLSAVSDMTPTNTPPANPKAAGAVNPTTITQPATTAKPTVSFAVPEGDSSNHITDMMPDDDLSDYDYNDAPVMPHISDDAAFSQKSRSMQTAAYRSSLTPIPEISILDKPDPDRQPSYTIAELEQLSELLEIKLQEFNVKAAVVNAIPGPVVTRFEVELAAGVKASKVTGISRDLARSLSMASLRVVEVIPGKPYIGIEVPNKQREMVRLIELLNTEKFNDPKAQISMAMGKDIGGNPIITDLARAPHMLVAGTTGSGKSVLVNSMLLSMLLKYTPNELRLILIDPKQLELANYNDIPHLLTPVVTDMTEAASALSWCVAEMERRYQLMSLLKVRKLNEFNKKVIAAEKSGNPMLDPLWRPHDSVSISQAPKLKTLPMIVIVADEFADMIMQVGKQAEELITRLAQKSRAAGIHLMLATQRPSVDVITGLIKANIPVRAALRVNSKVDSRTILDSGGAEDMLGNGDMLFLGPGQIEPDRVHGAYVSDEEVNRVCDAWRERGAPDYIDNMAGNFELSSPSSGSTANASGEDDDLYNDAVAFIMETRKVSASSIQRKFSIGYNRAARIVDSMEEAGLVSSMGKSGKRELLM